MDPHGNWPLRPHCKNTLFLDKSPNELSDLYYLDSHGWSGGGETLEASDLCGLAVYLPVERLFDGDGAHCSYVCQK
jgi:hypothetical protein